MGAQWELVSRIPLEERQQMIVQVERDILELQNEAQFFYFIKYRVLPRIQNRAQGQESDRKPLQVRLGTAAGIQTIIIPGDPVEFERMGRERSWNVVAAFLEQRISRYEGIAYEQEIGMLQVTLQSLRGAGLSKEHFLELQAPVHGYSGAQFVERAFTLTPYRRAGMSAMGLYVLYRLLQEDDDESEAAAGAPPVQAPAALLAH